MNQNLEFYFAGAALIVVLIGFWLFCLRRFIGFIATHRELLQNIIFGITGFCLSSSLVLRGIHLERFPCSNLYESLLVVALGLALIHLFLSNYSKIKFLDWPTALLIIATLAYAIWLPSSQKEAIPLIPALDSYWRIIHVPALLISYGFLTLAGIIAIFYLFEEKKTNNQDKLDSLQENMYKCVAFGFPLLTFGIVTGALWANKTWGNLWQWDPKENLALATWFCYAAYLHLKISKKVSNRALAWINGAGILVIYLTYLGINQFDLGGLHTYGKV
ncbi:MAG: c-type cytochrome biogenesis protein CcsB [Candidatus Caenarcaniphilales bacterium]|nr:c-type cytochrome biogenesis protein CcsB [Candidatus Caenarcaniphilales bacterium]